MPTIWIDQEVHEYLNERGRTIDAFNDVIRREFGFAPLRPKKRRGSNQAYGGEMGGRIIAAASRHLPLLWDGRPAQKRQILMVISQVLKTPSDWPTADREIAARKAVARELGVDPNTVLDKYGRQLYGRGTAQVAQFREALAKIVQDLQ